VLKYVPAARDNLDGYFSEFLRRQRMAAAKPYVTGRVLDFGCGIGLVCDWVGEGRYVGVDTDPGVLAFAKHHYPRARFVTPTQMDIIAGERFDTIVGLAVIEHLPDPLGFLLDAAKRLAPLAENDPLRFTPAHSTSSASKGDVLFEKERETTARALKACSSIGVSYRRQRAKLRALRPNPWFGTAARPRDLA
jgi:SAM-dependent methyltransferase